MTGNIAIIFGVIVVGFSIFFLIKQVETRTVLICAGFTMAIASLNPLEAFNAFSNNMIKAELIQNICSALGFAMVLQVTECDKHHIHAATKVLSRLKLTLIPGAVITTFVVNIAIPTAAGTAAAVGVVMIPFLISMGLSPAIAASAVMLGTFGSMLSPGLMHNPMIAHLTGVDVISVIKVHAPATIVSVIIGTISLMIVAKVLKEDKRSDSQDMYISKRPFKVNYFYATVPLVPIIIMIITNISQLSNIFKWFTIVEVPHAMLFSAFLCMLITRTSPQKAVNNFFDGMGKGYADILGIIISAGIFVAGMSSLGMVSEFIDHLKHSDNIVRITATYGPFLLALISGSGDAVAIAFNEAGSITSYATEFGMDTTQMGSLAALSSALGRTMSPLAGAAIICGVCAKVNPIDMTKRNAMGMIIASIVTMLMLGYNWDIMKILPF